MTVMARELTAGNARDRWDHPFFADPADVTAENYPRMRNISVGFLARRVVRPVEPTRPEYVTLPLEQRISNAGALSAIAKWNLLWEAAQFRRRFFDDDDDDGLPPSVAELADQGDVNLTLVPRTATRYYEYAPLYHLLSRSQLERHGLPLVGTGIWP
jgi:hypothetical protein